RRPVHRPLHRRAAPRPGPRAERHRVRRAVVRVHRRARERAPGVRADQGERGDGPGAVGGRSHTRGDGRRRPRRRPSRPRPPLAISSARTDEARRILEVAVHNDTLLVRTYTLPPGTPRDRVQTLRKAFQETLREPVFLAEAERTKLEIVPISAEEIERTVANL